MPLTLSGTLKDPYGNTLAGAVIRFDAVATSSDVLRHVSAEARADQDGSYAIEVEYGKYDIRVQTGRSFLDLARNVVINTSTSADSLNQLIVDYQGEQDLTPPIVIEFRGLVAEARGYRDEASASAQATSDDAEATALDRAHVDGQAAHIDQQRVAVDSTAQQVADDKAATGQQREAAEQAAEASETARNESRDWATGDGVIANIGGTDRFSARAEADRAASEREAAEGAATQAVDSAAEAADSANAAGQHEQESADNALEAQHWANYPVDSPVPEGDGEQKSSRHWAEIARQRAVNAMVAQGAWDASSGTLPAEPLGASYWLVTGAADGETVDGVEYRNKDMLLWTPGQAAGEPGTWSKIDNTDSVASVAGKTGAVELVASDVGLGGVRNVASYSQSESDGRYDAAGAAQAVRDDLDVFEARRDNPHEVTAAQAQADPAGTASSGIGAHEEAANPHDQYELKAALKSAAYSTVAEILDQVVPPVALTPAAFHKTDGSQPAWTTPDSTTLETASDISLVVGSSVVQIPSGTDITLPALSNGTDYTIYAAADGTLQAVDADSSAPADARKIGGFHVFLTGEIAPRSLWDLNWRPVSNPRAMVLSLDGQAWADIYLMDVEYALHGYSRAGQTIADDGNRPIIPAAYSGNGTDTYGSMSWWVSVDLSSAAGKRLPLYREFTAFAYGVVERQAVGTDPATTQHQAGHRSACGVEQVTGVMHQWGADVAATGGSSWGDIAEGRGDVYASNLKAVRLGATWTSGSNAGSRASHWNHAPSLSNAATSARAVCDHLNLQAAA